MAKGKNNPEVDKMIINGSYTSREIANKTGYHQCSVTLRARHLGHVLPLPPVAQVNHDFFKKWTPNMAYILGFIAADGCINYHKNFNLYRLSIGLQLSDVLHLENIVKMMDSDKKVYRYPQRNVASLQITSKTIFNDLQELGINPRKSLTLGWLPIPVGMENHFVRGYFDGDGCIHFRENHYKDIRCGIIATHDFAQGVQKTFDPNVGTIYQSKTCPSMWFIEYYGKNAIRFADWMYQDSLSTNRLSRKYDMYLMAKKLRNDFTGTIPNGDQVGESLFSSLKED